MPYIDSLIARGIVTPRSAERVAYVGRKPPGLTPEIGPEMGPRGGPRTYTGASGEKIVAPDYGAEAGSPASGWPKSDQSNLRSALRDKVYNEKSVKAREKATQEYYETQTNTPKGYAWINGRLQQVGPDKWGNPPPTPAAEPAPSTAPQNSGSSWLDSLIKRGQ